MKFNKLAIVAVLPLALSLGGCVVKIDGNGDIRSGYSDWEDREESNRKAISNLKLDLSADQVKSILGTPDFTEFHKADGEYMVLFYRTQRVKGDGMTTKDECTPLVFKENKLIGWGDATYRKI
ncbi:DUF3192 domain-containing protein [Alteromonas sp. a30]|uniref:DUF3192 domain-containing protein n=1 Tax=Alteromonas sp. a30 TaxID=2730917 RepID=UPI00227F8F92|nr:DUF3192 domain-containing protein [Alteromonas sp. a30]MCY7294334.1 DUF3192 domain-containing protein [Alteromonas sp. a30]